MTTKRQLGVSIQKPRCSRSVHVGSCRALQIAVALQCGAVPLDLKVRNGGRIWKNLQRMIKPQIEEIWSQQCSGWNSSQTVDSIFRFKEVIAVRVQFRMQMHAARTSTTNWNEMLFHILSVCENGRQQITGMVLPIKYKKIMNKLINLPQKYKSTQHPWSSAMRLPPQSCEQRFSQSYAKFSCEPRTICNGAAKFYCKCCQTDPNGLLQASVDHHWPVISPSSAKQSKFDNNPKTFYSGLWVEVYDSCNLNPQFIVSRS